MMRRPIACVVAVLVSGAVSLSASPAAAQPTGRPTDQIVRTWSAQEPTSTTDRLPGTTLEAQQRDEDTSLAPWLIGSGVAAAAAVAVGGTLLKRRSG